MRTSAVRMVLAIALVIAALPSLTFAQKSSCAQIMQACRSAGFVQGGVKEGKGVVKDCVQPIMDGTPQRRKASLALPKIDPQVVAACKAENPNFGQGRSGPAAPSPAASTKPAQPTAAAKAGSPNIVFVLTDDLALNLVQYMPNVLKMEKEGMTFSNYFVTDSLCCPSRSSIFTGRYPHDTGVFKNAGNDGGYNVFNLKGNDQLTFAVSLAAAGYRAAMMGKYLNGYQPVRDGAAAGWSEWDVAGNGYPEFNYDLNEDGSVKHYGRDPAEYLTDVLSAKAVQFIKDSKGKSFILEVATFAPHAPYTPAPRDADKFPGLRAPRGPAFNATPEADAPQWLRAVPPLQDGEIARIDEAFRMRAQSVQAVDKMIGELQAALAAIGAEKNTYFVFSSDNGYHMGEYRLRPGKMTAFDTDIHVPLVITGPGVPAGRAVEEITENVDLCPTFAELSGAKPPEGVDGFSLAPFLRGEKAGDWRTAALVEHHGPDNIRSDPDMPARHSGNPTTYEAIRGRTWVYVEYTTGEKEYHDLAKDPDELHNTYDALSKERKAELHALLNALQNCHGQESCKAAGK